MNPQLLRAAVVVAVTLAGVIATLSFGIIGGLLPLVVVLGCFLIGRPRTYLFAFWTWAVIGELVLFLLNRPGLAHVSLALDAGLLLLLLATHILERRPILTAPPVTFAAVGLLVITVISFLANQPPLLSSLHFVLAYFRFLLLFLYMRYFLKDTDPKLFYMILLGTVALQAIPNAGWLLGLNPIPNLRISSSDFAVGTVQSCTSVAYLCIACIATLLPVLLNRRMGHRERRLALAAIALAGNQLWFTYTIHAYILIVICCGVYLVAMSVRWRTRLAIVATALVMLLVVVPAMARTSNHSYKRRIINQLNLDYVRFRWQRMVTGVKGQAYKNVLLVARRDMPYPFLGAGPGNFGSAMARTYRRPLADRYFNFVVMADTANFRQLSHGGSITGIPYNGMLAIWSELGPLGYVLYWGLHVYAMWRVWLALRRRKYKDPYQHVLAEGFCMTMLAWLILNFLSDFCHVRFLHGGLWIWAAIVWAPVAAKATGSSRSSRSNRTSIPKPTDTGEQWHPV